MEALKVALWDRVMVQMMVVETVEKLEVKLVG